jgi:competence protein ComEA
MYLCEIVQPGVYQVPRGSRVNDLLLLAGGLTKNADGSSINLAAQLRDGPTNTHPASYPDPDWRTEHSNFH